MGKSITTLLIAQRYNTNIRAVFFTTVQFRVNGSDFEDFRGDLYSVNLEPLFLNLQDLPADAREYRRPFFSLALMTTKLAANAPLYLLILHCDSHCSHRVTSAYRISVLIF